MKNFILSLHGKQQFVHGTVTTVLHMVMIVQYMLLTNMCQTDCHHTIMVTI